MCHYLFFLVAGTTIERSRSPSSCVSSPGTSLPIVSSSIQSASADSAVSSTITPNDSVITVSRVDDLNHQLWSLDRPSNLSFHRPWSVTSEPEPSVNRSSALPDRTCHWIIQKVWPMWTGGGVQNTPNNGLTSGRFWSPFRWGGRNPTHRQNADPVLNADIQSLPV